MDNYYQTLNVPPTATRSEIKLAYHTLLLKHHPDKKIIPENNSSSLSSSPVDISLLKEAYTTLSSPLSRSQYDTSLKNFLPLPTAAKLNPRPAQIISLEDFTQSQSQEADAWDYPCRCGGVVRKLFGSGMNSWMERDHHHHHKIVEDKVLDMLVFPC
ncbi:hypothetical protein Ac2012v2_001056 [Leucoagaricus gongylophorus]